MSRRARLLSPLLLTLAALAGCAVNPVTGETEFMLVSESQEQELGREADQQIVAQYGVVTDANLANYVSDLGQRLAQVSHVKDWSFTFRLLDDPVVNAFALPGGYCYVTRGILAYLDSEAALAGVMGHEIGHVAARHGAQRMTRQTLFGLTFGLAGTLFGEGVGSLLGVASGAGELLMLKYGRDDERQSDELGVQYASSLGYDTADMAEFFNTLGRISDLSGSRLPSFLSTHPDPGERYETVLQLTQKAQQPGQTYTRERDAFLQRLEGLTFGPDPRQGLLRDGHFHHPELRFSFPVPQGWQVQNSASQVVMAPESGELAVIFTLGEGASAAAAADAFGGSQGVTVSKRVDLRVDGDPAVRLWTQVQSDQQTVATVSTFVQRDGRIYVFHGLAQSAQAVTQHEAQLVAVADGFARLTDPQLLNVQPVRLHVISADRTAPFADLVGGWPIPADAGIDAARLALLNGVQPGDTIQRGTKLKVLTQGR